MPEEQKDKQENVAKQPVDAKPAEATAKAPDTKASPKDKTKKKKERPTNCAVCNKSFKHKRWYYKNGKYFCTKRCWEKLDAEIKAKAAEAKAKEAEVKAKEAESKEPTKSPENPPA